MALELHAMQPSLTPEARAGRCPAVNSPRFALRFGLPAAPVPADRRSGKNWKPGLPGSTRVQGMGAKPAAAGGPGGVGAEAAETPPQAGGIRKSHAPPPRAQEV